ncbi:MAG TPA: hypothetical protein VFI47_24275 [Acidimicrobiales bacterium]|nr:hypothetical protein [Acidimicrobiales bacterium]
MTITDTIPALPQLPTLPGEVRAVRLARGRTTRTHNAVMEDLFTALRAGSGAAAALAAGAVPARGGVPVFRCSIAHTARAPIANPSQPRRTVNFYEVLPTLDGAPFEPGTPLPPGVWTIAWTCPLYPAAHGGPAGGAFHVGVGVAGDDLPPAWGRNAAGPLAGVPGNVTVPAVAGGRLAGALHDLAGYREAAERAACDVMRGFVAAKAARVRNAQPTVFDHDDAVQEGLAKLVVVMRRFAARGRPKACWTVAAGLVLERDLPRAADRLGHLPSSVAHCAHWLVQTDLVELGDPRLTPERAADAYAHDQRSRQRRARGTRRWLDTRDDAKPAFPPDVWRSALDEARRGGPVSLDRLAESRAADGPGAAAGVADLVPTVDRDLALVGERRLVDLVEDLLVGTGLGYADLRDHLYPRLARRDYRDETLTGDRPADGDPTAARSAAEATAARSAAEARRLATAAENRLLALVARPGESLARDRSELRRRVREVLFDDAGRFRPTEERRRRWAEHRA